MHATSLLAQIYGWIFVASLWILRATWRVRNSGIDQLDDHFRRGERFIACFWHGVYIPLFVLLRNRSACIFTSDSFRGRVISRICRHFGYRPILIPEKGEEAHRRMRTALAGEQAVAIAADGPLGPHHVPKRGPVRLASELGIPLLAVSVAGSRNWTDESRWDQRTIPRPFSTVAIACGELLRVPPDLSDEELEPWQRTLAAEIERVDEEAIAGLSRA